MVQGLWCTCADACVRACARPCASTSESVRSCTARSTRVAISSSESMCSFACHLGRAHHESAPLHMSTPLLTQPPKPLTIHLKRTEGEQTGRTDYREHLRSVKRFPADILLGLGGGAGEYGESSLITSEFINRGVAHMPLAQVTNPPLLARRCFRTHFSASCARLLAQLFGTIRGS